MTRLSETEGLASEVVRPRTHRNGYDYSLRVGGADLATFSDGKAVRDPPTTGILAGC